MTLWQSTSEALTATGEGTIIHRPAAPVGRKLAIAAGICFLITHVTSFAALILYTPLLNDVNYIVGSGPDTRPLVGAFLEVILAFAVVGTGVTLFPVVKRQSEAGALGYVGLRTLEAGIIAVGVVSLLAAITLRQAGAAGADPGSMIVTGRALVALHNATFLVGPSFTSGIDTLLLAYMLYRSRLVPRFIPLLGLIGGSLVFASATSVLFGVVGQYSVWPGVTALPEFAWELSLALYLITKGFRPPALTAGR